MKSNYGKCSVVYLQNTKQRKFEDIYFYNPFQFINRADIA